MRLLQRFHDTAGTATIEFALVFPVVLFFALLLLQTALLMAGQQYVNYAAFCAARSAIVEIPRGVGAGPNRIITDDSSPKWAMVHQAAVFALVPAAGRLDNGDADAARYADAWRQHFASYPGNAPKWVDTYLGPKLAYAKANTTVQLLMTTTPSEDRVAFQAVPAGSGLSVGPKDPITVRVTHKFSLVVPYVRGLFADGKQTTEDGQGAYTNLTAQCTLTNQGIDRELPPAPPIPRQDN